MPSRQSSLCGWQESPESLNMSVTSTLQSIETGLQERETGSGTPSPPRSESNLPNHFSPEATVQRRVSKLVLLGSMAISAFAQSTPQQQTPIRPVRSHDLSKQLRCLPRTSRTRG